MKNIAIKTIATILSFIFSIGSVFIVNAETNDSINDKYKNIILANVYSKEDLEDENFQIDYKELFSYYSQPNTTIPDFVLVYITTNIVSGNWEAEVYDDYILRQDYGYLPFKFGYAIYLPKTNEIFSLSEAYENKIENVDILFTELGIGELIGDMDKDRKITIKDATYIQKCLANIYEFDNDEIWAYIYNSKAPLKYISDFNRDCSRNIKDATAIQRHLAKMEY